MSQHCCEHDTPAAHTLQNPARYRRILWIALLINAAMFGVELLAGWRSGSLSLLADAIDFAGDALNYGVSLAVLSAALAWRARAALLKSVSMMGFGLLVLGRAAWSLWQGSVPDATTMGVVGFLALAANIAVMLAALGVLSTGSGWPDLLVAVGMAALALQGGWQVWRQARGELAQTGHGGDHDHHGHAH